MLEAVTIFSTIAFVAVIFLLINQNRKQYIDLRDMFHASQNMVAQLMNQQVNLAYYNRPKEPLAMPDFMHTANQAEDELAENFGGVLENVTN